MSSRVTNGYGAVGIAAALILALGLGMVHAAEAPGRYQGVLGDAHYLINVPPDWNGGLVLFAHGYEGEGSGTGTACSSPFEAHLTRRGYAWAASGYRAWGYRPDWFLLDLLELRALFINRLGQPRWTIIHGQSMGGHISIATLELYPDVYRGGLIECGNIDGVGLTDWLHAYTAAAEYFSGLPLLDTPRPEFSAPATVTWPELMGEPGYYTERGRRFDTSSSTSPAVTCRSASKGRWSAMSRTLTRAIPGRDVPGNSSVTRIHGTSPTTLTPGWASMPQP